MIYFANPSQKRSAHVTIAGPILTKPDKIELPKWPLYLSVLGPGTFFNERQNTVFLKCDSEWLRNYWAKKEYGYNPHITIYDGSSRPFAERLMLTLKSHRLFFELVADEIDVIGSHKGQHSLSLNLELKTEPWLGSIISPTEYEGARNMKDWKRITVIDRLCTVLSGLVRQGR
jgi:hypothetical protein